MWGGHPALCLGGGRGSVRPADTRLSPGMKVKRGDQQLLSYTSQLRPFLLAMVVPPHRVESQSRRYKRDAPGLDYCSQ